MSEIEPKKSISIKKSKKKKVTIEESVSSFDDGRGGRVTISTIQSFGPDDRLTYGSNDGPLIQEFNEDGTINEELIFSGEYTKAMSKDWHSAHFCCWQCDGSLTGMRYVLREDHPFCIKCYEQVHKTYWH
jgi:hypothetical protein